MFTLHCSSLLLVIAFAQPIVRAAPEASAGRANMLRQSRFIPSTSRFPLSNILPKSKFIGGGDLFDDSGRHHFTDMGRPKRALFDDSCKGDFDRKIFVELDRVCEDCYNLYRKPSVSYECRKNCFQSSVYQQCVASLLLPVLRYIDMAQILYTKKHKFFSLSNKQLKNRITKLIPYTFNKDPYRIGIKLNCFSNRVFETCLYDLMLYDLVDNYAEMVQSVGKK